MHSTLLIAGLVLSHFATAFPLPDGAAGVAPPHTANTAVKRDWIKDVLDIFLKPVLNDAAEESLKDDRRRSVPEDVEASRVEQLIPGSSITNSTPIVVTVPMDMFSTAPLWLYRDYTGTTHLIRQSASTETPADILTSKLDNQLPPAATARTQSWTPHDTISKILPLPVRRWNRPPKAQAGAEARAHEAPKPKPVQAIPNRETIADLVRTCATEPYGESGDKSKKPWPFGMDVCVPLDDIAKSGRIDGRPVWKRGIRHVEADKAHVGDMGPRDDGDQEIVEKRRLVDGKQEKPSMEVWPTKPIPHEGRIPSDTRIRDLVRECRTSPQKEMGKGAEMSPFYKDVCVNVVKMVDSRRVRDAPEWGIVDD
ncbi:Hit family protein 1 [Sphaceloma murrayae]|uniref:Hit family protein 1 n=1 Tax=Sphaceloma murrayae TaxID=2082308 RepID=A0A2K1QH40_9PEZI|nr:Hit family protein 1 [Sphaceloma murrayae]